MPIKAQFEITEQSLGPFGLFCSRFHPHFDCFSDWISHSRVYNRYLKNGKFVISNQIYLPLCEGMASRLIFLSS